MDIETLRIEIAKRGGVLLPPNDPLFALVVANEIVLGDLVEQMKAAQTDMRLQSAAMVATEVAGVKASAEKLIGGAVRVFQDAARTEAATIKNTLSDATAKRLMELQSTGSAANPWLYAVVAFFIGALFAKLVGKF